METCNCRYAAGNAAFSTAVGATLDVAIPGFLRNRPFYFIKHCVTNLQAAKDWNGSMLSEENVGLFKVCTERERERNERHYIGGPE